MWKFVTLEWTSMSWAGSLTPSPLPPPNHHPTITELRWTSDVQEALAPVQSGNSRPKASSCLCFSAWETGPRDHHTEWSQSDRERVHWSLHYILTKLPLSAGIPAQPCCCSVAQSCLTLCNPMDCSTPGSSVHHQLLEHIKTHVHRVGDATQPSHPLLSPSPPAFKLSHHQALFKWVSSRDVKLK